MSGAHAPTDLERDLRTAGFVDVRVDLKPASREFIAQWMPGSGAEDYVTAADVTARKPGDVHSRGHSHGAAHAHGARQRHDVLQQHIDPAPAAAAAPAKAKGG